ncbi:MAG: DoxX family membrane protein [Leptolyngbyaceae cyanobacterium bins.302]|nr:DoxX family membrane protein [Leptolyngbyaceae cyanobacterium bins.302]
MHQQPVNARPWGFRQKDVELAYFFLRLIFGVNFFNHGFTRIGNIGGFANSMVDMFKDAAVPAELVRVVGAIVPPLELIIGILLIVGFATRGALIAGFVLMMILQGGVLIVGQLDSAVSQLIYCIIFFLLLATVGFNTISLDTKFRRQRHPTSEI